MVEPVEVMRGTQRDLSYTFGPLPGFRLDDMLVYEFALPDRFEPWSGRMRLERTFVLLDVGVSFANPYWVRTTNPDGSVTEMDPQGRDSWYADLLSVTLEDGRYMLRDLFIDLIIPMDGRPYRLLDLDEYADAMGDGTLPLAMALDGLQRWQRFVDCYLQAGRWPQPTWSDFPPQALRPLMDLAAPLGVVVVVGD